MDQEVMEVLIRYAWPGNVRELQNAIKHAVVMAKGALVTSMDLPERVIEKGGERSRRDGGRDGFFHQRDTALAEFERAYFVALLTKHKGEVGKVVAEVRLPTSTVYYFLKKHMLKPTDFRS